MVTTISNNIVTIKSPCDIPVQSLKVYFSAIQSGDGDPSPTNVRSITGWTGLDVTRCGKNLFNPWSNGYWYTSSKQWESESASIVCKPIHMNSGTTVTISQTNESATYQFHEWDKCVSTPSAYTNADNLSFIRSSDGQGKTYTAQTDKFLTAFANIGKDTIAIRKVQLELGYMATSYEPYSGTTTSIDWASEAGTLYGGYVDLISGELVQTHYGMYINRNTIPHLNIGDITETYTQAWFLNSTDNIPKFKLYTGLSNRFKCLKSSKAVVNGFINFSGNTYFMIPSSDLTTKDIAGILDWFDANPTFLVAELYTPMTYQLNPSQLNILRGYNNIFSTANGECEVTYEHNDANEIVNIRRNIIGAMPALEHKTGSLAHFKTNITAPLQSCIVQLPYDANGYTGVTVTRCGVNMLHCTIYTYNANGIVSTAHMNADNEVDYYSVSGKSARSSNLFTNLNYIANTKRWPPYGVNYATCAYSEMANVRLVRGSGSPRDRNGHHESVAEWIYYDNLSPNSASDEWARFQFVPYSCLDVTYSGKLYPLICVEEDAGCEFEPYKGNDYTVSWSQTIYGGYVDLAIGELVSTYSSSGTQIEPVIYSVTPQIITPFYGVNNIYSKTGNITVKYWTH